MPAKRSFYPVFFDLDKKLVVVIGEGAEATHRANLLLEVGATVRVVSAEPTAALRDLAAEGRIELVERTFVSDDIKGSTLGIACGTSAINEAVREAATTHRVPLNVVDGPALSDWIHGSVVRRDALVIAISTSGAAPALAVRMKEHLAAEYGPEYGHFLDLAAEHRDQIVKTGLSFEARRQLWYRIADSDILEALRGKDESRARAIFADEIARGVTEAKAK